jgi:hypothetical protein
MVMNFSTIGRTLPGLQYMISRMSSMGGSWLKVLEVLEVLEVLHVEYRAPDPLIS